jgi:hypothetical protein
LCHDLFANARFHAFLLEADRQLAADARNNGCDCGGPLHQANYPRKPRGGPQGLGPGHDERLSFCCAEDGCRRRTTPPSLRFLGRRVYFATVVVLISAMRHGATPERMRRLRAVVGVDRRTVERWRQWWRTDFIDSPFWRVIGAALIPPVATAQLPASLLTRFRGKPEARLIAFLRWLGPITGGANGNQAC